MRWAGACRSPIEPLRTDWNSDSVSLASLDRNRFIVYFKTQFLAAQTYMLVKMQFSLHYKHCEFKTILESVVSKKVGFAGLVQSR